MSRLRLALTDDDPAEHGPFDTCVKTEKCYEDAISMLCVFHGVVMKFQEQIYPKLPHRKGTKLLTKQGDLYGECIEAESSRPPMYDIPGICLTNVFMVYCHRFIYLKNG